MYIKSIVIDGFKSYAKRTEITGFDPAFNAITGLNGSGKSNILDAICFLLGITNLSHVRATNLQDLVYKGGQAGVTKATVSVVFDNSAKMESPIGYENFQEITITRQIVMGGKNKYLINGITATNSRVHDLFHSVQLNVNNPHFLIMQGRITKVLNMKPPEILSLLEEAAATKLYESKRESTLATIEKKESKMKEIEKLLREEIRPKLEKLRQERSSYMEYQNISREIEYLNKFIIGYKYFQLKVTVDNADGQLSQLKAKRSKEEAIIIQCNETKNCIEQSLAALGETRVNDILPRKEQLDAAFSEMQKDEALLKNSVKRALDSLESVKKNLNNLAKEKANGIKASKQIQKKMDGIQSQYDSLQNRVQEDKVRFEKAQKRLQEVNFGLFTDDSGEATASLSDMVAVTFKAESELETEINVLKMRITHSQKLIKELELKIRGLQRDAPAAELEKDHNRLRARLTQVNESLAQINHSPDKYAFLAQRLMTQKDEIRTNENQKNNILNSNRWLKFEYSPPNPNFDRGAVKGVVASLFKVVDPVFCTALQTAAGSKIFNIVVDTDDVAAQLINGNCMKERKTFLPLNKIHGDSVPDQHFRNCERIVGSENCWQVLDLVRFDERFRKAVTYVFGRCIVARNLSVAKTIAFDNRIKYKAVTLDGDVFDPEGTLSGGSNQNSGDLLIASQQLSGVNEALNNLYQSKKEVEEEMKTTASTEKQWKELMKERDDLEIRIRRLEIKMQENEYLDLSKKMTDTKQELEALSVTFETKKAMYEQARKKTAQARENLANAASVKEKAQKDAQNEINDSKVALEASEAKFLAVETEYESLVTDLRSNEDDDKHTERMMEEARQEMMKKETEVEDEKEKLKSHGDKVLVRENELNEVKRSLMKVDQEIETKRADMKKCIETKEKAENCLEEVNHSIELHHIDSVAAEDKVKKMLRNHAWIAEESSQFGVSGSMYDFEANNFRSAEQKVEKLNDQKQKLSRKVDMRGMNMLGQMETRYDEVTSKYNLVKKDKKMLEDVINELDKRKDEVLRKAHEQVDRDFDVIFSTLLPGSRARLTPPQGKTLKEGLEFRICFGNVWKESLTELSGGQRSLVALSLILALLRFKPAPLYILDEVDAALDISHTQNIGTIIKEQFSNSQFIIVSLKDGMFNNANVLYKTKFVDGVSTVTRHVNQARRPMTEKNG